MDYWWAATLNTDSPDTSETTWQPPKLLPLRWRAAETLFIVRVRLGHWAARSLATTRWKLDVRTAQIWRQQHLTSLEFRDTAQCWTHPLRMQPLRMRPSSRRPLRVRRNKTQSIGQYFHSGEFALKDTTNCTQPLQLGGFTHCQNTSICARMLDWLVVTVVPKATLTAWVEKQKRDRKRCAKPFKQAEHTLYPRHRVHPVVQLPISITSSVPEMSASRSPRGLLLLPSLATQDATSAFTVPLRPQEVGGTLHNRTETGILGQNQGTVFRVTPDHGRSLRHSKSHDDLDADLW